MPTPRLRAIRPRLRFFARRCERHGSSLLFSQGKSTAVRGRELFIARGTFRDRHYRRRQRVYVDVSDSRYATWDDGLAAVYLLGDRLLLRFLPRCTTVPWREVEVELIGLEPAPILRRLRRICVDRVPVLTEVPAKRRGCRRRRVLTASCESAQGNR